MNFNIFCSLFDFVLDNLVSINAMAISGPVDEFVNVIFEFPFIANDPDAFVLILYGFIICVCLVPFL